MELNPRKPIKLQLVTQTFPPHGTFHLTESGWSHILLCVCLADTIKKLNSINVHCNSSSMWTAGSVCIQTAHNSRVQVVQVRGCGRRQEAGGRRQEAGGRRQEAGGRRQDVDYPVEILCFCLHYIDTGVGPYHQKLSWHLLLCLLHAPLCLLHAPLCLLHAPLCPPHSDVLWSFNQGDGSGNSGHFPSHIQRMS